MTMRLPSLEPGQRLPAETYGEIVRGAQASRVQSGGGGATVFQTPGGTAFVSQQPETIPVFLIRETEAGTLLGKEGFRDIDAGTRQPVGPWRVANVEKFVVGWPWGGFSVDDFREYFLADPDVVTDDDRAVQFRDGYYYLPGAQARAQAKLVRVIAISGNGLLVQEVAMQDAETWTDTGEPFVAAPWPGQRLDDYRSKSTIIMRAEQYNEQWVVLMTGDRRYAPFPSEFCDRCQ